MKTVDDIKWIILMCDGTKCIRIEDCPHPAICCHMNYLAFSMILKGEY